MEDDGAEEEYEPSEQEVLEYCEWLGMDVVHDRCLMWISREALKAPLPENWKVCYTEEREAYYFNTRTGESIWDHPMDAYYKALYKQEKAALDKKRKKMRMYSGSLPIVPLVDFFSERVMEDAVADPALMAKDKPWVSLPDSLCDPIDYKLFYEPVVLPTSGRTVSRHTIINNRWRDPFSREYIENRRLVPNVDKRREVDVWLDTAIARYFELITSTPQGLQRLVRILPYLVDKDEEMCVRGQTMFLQWLTKSIATLPPLALCTVSSVRVEPRVTTPRKGKAKAAGSAVTAVREGSSQMRNSAKAQAPPPPPPPASTFLNEISSLPDEDMTTLLAALLTMSTGSSINILWLLLTKIPVLGSHSIFHNFSPEVLNVLHLSPTDLNVMKSHCSTKTEGTTTQVVISNSDDVLSLQWILLLAELSTPVYILHEVEWSGALTLFTAMLHNATVGTASRPNTMCNLVRTLKGWPEKLSTVDEPMLVMLMDVACQSTSDVMVPVMHDVCIHGGERLMDIVRVRRALLLTALIDVYNSDPSNSTMLVTLAHLGAILVFHEVCKLDDFITTPSLALQIGQNLFPRLTRMQWRPKHFEGTVGRLISMCTANPVLSSTVLKTSAVDFLLKELGKKKRNHDDVRVRVDSVEADMRRLEQSNAINNWLLLTTGAKLQLLEQCPGGKPVRAVKSTATKERMLPTLGRQASAPVDPDSDGEEDFGDRLRALMEKGLQKRIDIATERAQHTTSILSMLLAMRLKPKAPSGRAEQKEPIGQKGNSSTRLRNKDTKDEEVNTSPEPHCPPAPEPHICALPRI
jgi:hypothetical protein